MGRDQEKLGTAPGRTAQEEAEDERRWPEGHFGSDKETLGSGQGEEGGVASPGEESWPKVSKKGRKKAVAKKSVGKAPEQAASQAAGQ